MAGFSETDENGQTLMEKYLQLADESGNIVDEKYVDQADSLTAALTNLSNAFNALTASVTDSEAIKGFVNVLADAISGVATLNDSLLGIPGVLATIGVAALALSSLIKFDPTLLAVFAAIAAIGAVGWGISRLGKGTETKTSQEQLKTNIDSRNKETKEKQDKATSLLNKATQIHDKAVKGNADQNDLNEYNSIVLQLRSLGYTSLSVVGNLEDLSKGAQNVAEQLNNTANDIKDSNNVSLANDILAGYNAINNTAGTYYQGATEYNSYVDAYNERLPEIVKGYANQYTNGLFDYALGLYSRGYSLNDVSSFFSNGTSIYQNFSDEYGYSNFKNNEEVPFDQRALSTSESDYYNLLYAMFTDGMFKNVPAANAYKINKYDEKPLIGIGTTFDPASFADYATDGTSNSNIMKYFLMNDPNITLAALMYMMPYIEGEQSILPYVEKQAPKFGEVNRSLLETMYSSMLDESDYSSSLLIICKIY